MAYAFDDFVFDDARFELRRAGALLHVDAQVLELLAVLVKNHERLVTKEELLDEVWRGRALGDNVISVCVAKLRKTLGGSSYRAIGSMYGRGYRFLRPVTKTEALPLTAAARLIAPTEVAPYVGRDAAVARLQSALERARQGRGSVCALLGEAGIGKTRAAEELESLARAAHVNVVWGRCHAFGDAPPLWPLFAIARACGAALPTEDAQTRDSERDATDAWEPRTQDAWHKALSWLDSVVAQLARTGPWLVLLEDVQWADALTLQLLSHLVAETANLPLLVVLTVRDTELPIDRRCRRALDYVLGHRECARIELSRLSQSDVHAYTDELFGPVSAELDQAVFARSEGNPFFMVELLRPFIGRAAPAPEALALSGPALDIVRQALRGLEPAARDVLAAAAVIGRGFDLGLLGAVTEREPEALLEVLDAAMAAHVIVAAPDSAVHFTFGHDLIRSVLHDDLSRTARAQLHRRIAQALASKQTAAEGRSSSELAHHLLDALPLGDPAQAIEHAGRAAQASVRVGAYAVASALLRRALAALELLPANNAVLRCQLLFGLASCERGSGEPFLEHLQAAVALAREHRIATVLSAAGQAMSAGPGTLAMEDTGSVLEAALDALPLEQHAERASVLAYLSWTPPHCADAARVSALLEQAEHHASLAGPAAQRTVLRAKLYYAGGPDDHERALALANELEQAVASRGAQQRARWSLEAIISRIVGFLVRGDFTRARHTVEAFGTAARELQHAELLWHYERMCVVLRMNLGEYAWAKPQLVALKERAERLQLHARKALEAIDWGVLLRQTADITPFASQLALALAPSAADAPSGQAYKLRALVQLGLVEDVRRRLSDLPPESLRALPKSRDYLATLAHLAFASAATRSRAHAAVLYELLSPYPDQCVASLSLHCYGAVSYFLALLARVLGERAQAIRHFEEAIALDTQLGLGPPSAEARYELARTLLEASEPGQTPDRLRAHALLAQAHDTASQLSMQPLCAAIDQLTGAR